MAEDEIHSITDSMDMDVSKLQTVEDRGAWRAAVQRVAKSWIRLRTEQPQLLPLPHALKLQIY